MSFIKRRSSRRKTAPPRKSNGRLDHSTKSMDPPGETPAPLTQSDRSDVEAPADREEEEVFLIYRLSCKHCPHHYFYEGETTDVLKEVLFDHIQEIHHIANVEADGGKPHKSQLSDFGQDTFAKHVVEQHCLAEDMLGEDQLIDWWKDNVAVQVRQHIYEKRHADKLDGTFQFKQREEPPEFIQNQQEKEEEFNEKQKQQEEVKRQQIMESNVLAKGDAHVFDEIWDARFRELKTFADTHEGSTIIPKTYMESPMLPIWVDKQRTQYRRKRNIRPTPDIESNMTDAKEASLKAIGFQFYEVAKQRWSECGIEVVYGVEDVTDKDVKAAVQEAVAEVDKATVAVREIEAREEAERLAREAEEKRKVDEKRIADEKAAETAGESIETNCVPIDP